MSSEPSTSVTTPNSPSPLTGVDGVKSPDDIISEKSAKIKEWVKQRLAHVGFLNSFSLLSHV